MDPKLSLPFITRDMLAFEPGTAFSLVLNLVSKQTNPLEVRGFTKEGPFNYRIVPAGIGDLETFTLAIPDIPVMVSVTGDPGDFLANNTQATLHLGINGTRAVVLGQGTLGPTFGITWPHQVPPTSIQNLGVTDVINGTQPAAGAECVITTPDNEWWKLIRAHFKLDTDGNAANRTVRLDIEPASDLFITAIHSTAITANQIVTVAFVPDGTTATVVAAELHEVALPRDIWIPPGSTIETTTTNIQNGDQYAAPALQVLRFFSPA